MQKQLEKITAAKIAECYEQREEIMKAFVAKYGFEPDECRQIESPIGYCVVRLDLEDAETFKKELIRDRFNRKCEHLNWWQRFCVWMANL